MIFKRAWQWLKNKIGRVITALGSALALADLDLSPIKDQLESFLSHKVVQAVTVVLFVASFVRHHWVARQNPVNAGSPPPSQ